MQTMNQSLFVARGRQFFALGAATLAVGLWTLAGCGPGEDAAPAPRGEHHEEDEHPDAADAHAREGPHGGHLIDLGHGDYHAELVHDDATHQVTIYLLDGRAEQSVPAALDEIVVNLVLAGEAAQFKLPAAPLQGDPPGQSSRFELEDERLCDGWDAPNSQGRLNVTIGGKPFVGTIEPHSHSGEEHH